ncbi:MAG: vancomycin high temperature exclusion protein [Chitinophagaceae bacterium]|nr:MAG: vancomycin high temperature exclusion protein [Chitinophagaceae bacterium]
MRKKIFLYCLLTLSVIAFLFIYFCNKSIKKSAEGKLYTDADAIPFNKVGLLLGTSKYLTNGLANLYYQYRIEATVKLYKKGKIKYIVVSGDNGREEYNEPEEMRQDLMTAGVDSSHIFLDYAGFRTFDSMVRLKKIFSQEAATIISQPFHNERAIYIAAKEGITAIGFNARDVNAEAGLIVQVRERFARVKVFLDYMFGNEPKFLGEKVLIP